MPTTLDPVAVDIGAQPMLPRQVRHLVANMKPGKSGLMTACTYPVGLPQHTRHEQTQSRTCQTDERVFDPRTPLEIMTELSVLGCSGYMNL